RADVGVAQHLLHRPLQHLEVAGAGVGLVPHELAGQLLLGEGRGTQGAHVEGDLGGGEAEDVEARLGQVALALLQGKYQETRFANYDSQMAKLRAEFQNLTPEEWNQSIYSGWLYALHLQNEPFPVGLGLPTFCLAPAYADKCLVTACGSWAQLRHDALLYAKQSYTMLATALPPRQSEEPQSEIVYVEPRPAVFVQLETLATGLKRRLGDTRMLSQDLGQRLERLGQLARAAGQVATGEQQGRSVDDALVHELFSLGSSLEQLVSFPEQESGLASEAQTMATVADVHTDPNAGIVLEVAVGNPLEIIALVPFAGRYYLARGGMLSYYEFTRPIDARMTDVQWQAMSPRPPLVDWCGSFVAP
ncbi:MAG: DUF3160 domain-containing protein, partial [candidate division WOR-3 bacterium]